MNGKIRKREKKNNDLLITSVRIDRTLFDY